MARGTWLNPRIAVAAALVLLTRLATVPRTFWELDEFLFAQGILEFAPLAHHPHPPGYPLLIGLGKIFHALTRDPFYALIVLSVLSSVATFVALALAFRDLLGDWPAILAASLFLFSPGMLVHSVLPMSDPPAIMFLALALLAASRLSRDQGSFVENSILLGVASSASVGCRPQYAMAILPMLLAAVLVAAARSRTRSALITLAAFTVTSLVWIIPLIVATGGFDGFLKYELGQAAYVAKIDAEMARSGKSFGWIVSRFVAHPWGPKWLALPVLISAALGVWVALRRRMISLIPLMVFAAVHVAFCIAVNDPADGVRYVIPAHMATAVLAMLGGQKTAGTGPGTLEPTGEVQRRARIEVSVVAAILSVAAIVYTAPALIPRTNSASPPVRAARYATRAFAKNSVILYETSMKPHAEFLFRRFRTMPIDAGLRAHWNDPSAPLYLLADGGTRVKDGVIFSWPDSDAYRKLTRNHYRVVSLIPLTSSRRYEPVVGVFPYERTPNGEEWRWLAPSAELRVSPSGVPLFLALSLPPDSHIESNIIHVDVNGAEVARTEVTRGRVSRIELHLGGALHLRIRSERSYTPATSSDETDPRPLGVQLVGLERMVR